MITNGEDTTSSEEEKDEQNISVNTMHQVIDSLSPSNYKNVTNAQLFNGQMNSKLNCSMNGSNSHSNEDEKEAEDDDEEDEDDDDNNNKNDHDALDVEENSIPTIYFSHTVEPKRVGIFLTLLILYII